MYALKVPVASIRQWPEVCLDLASGLGGLAALIVAAHRLGTLNHTLLTIEAVRMRGLKLAGLILNQAALQTDALMDNAAGLERWLQKFPHRECRTVPKFCLMCGGARPFGDAVSHCVVRRYTQRESTQMILTYECSADVHWGMDLLNKGVIVSFLKELFHRSAVDRAEIPQFKSWYGAGL